MAITGLLGGNIPDWLGDWLLDPSSSQAYTSTIPTWLSDWAFEQPRYRQTTSALSPYRTQVFYSPLVEGAQGLFDSLGGDPQAGPGGTGISGPGAVSPTGMESTATTATGKSISELAALASLGFENQAQKSLMQTVAALAPVPGISAVVGLGQLANQAAAREEISKIVDFAFLDEFSDEEFGTLQALANQSLFGGMFDEDPLAEVKGLFSNIGEQEGYGVPNYGEEEVAEAIAQGLEPFGGLGMSPDAAAVSGLDSAAAADLGAGSPEGGEGGDGGASGPGDGDPKIICSMMNRMYGFGSFRNNIWLHYQNTLQPQEEYELGYHKVFMPLVKRMPTNKLIRKSLEYWAKQRTQSIRKELRGEDIGFKHKLLRKPLEALFFGVGKLIKKGVLKKADITPLKEMEIKENG